MGKQLLGVSNNDWDMEHNTPYIEDANTTKITNEGNVRKIQAIIGIKKNNTEWSQLTTDIRKNATGQTTYSIVWIPTNQLVKLTLIKGLMRAVPWQCIDPPRTPRRLLGWISEIAEAIINTLQQAYRTLVNTIAAAMQTIINTLEGLATAIMEGIRMIAAGIMAAANFIAKIFKDTLLLLREFGQQFIGMLKRTANKIAQTFKFLLKTTAWLIARAVMAFLSMLKNLIPISPKTVSRQMPEYIRLETQLATLTIYMAELKVDEIECELYHLIIELSISPGNTTPNSPLSITLTAKIPLIPNLPSKIQYNTSTTKTERERRVVGDKPWQNIDQDFKTSLFNILTYQLAELLSLLPIGLVLAVGDLPTRLIAIGSAAILYGAQAYMLRQYILQPGTPISRVRRGYLEGTMYGCIATMIVGFVTLILILRAGVSVERYEQDMIHMFEDFGSDMVLFAPTRRLGRVAGIMMLAAVIHALTVAEVLVGGEGTLGMAIKIIIWIFRMLKDIMIDALVGGYISYIDVLTRYRGVFLMSKVFPTLLILGMILINTYFVWRGYSILPSVARAVDTDTPDIFVVKPPMNTTVQITNNTMQIHARAVSYTHLTLPTTERV